jgi:hypothetical protein
MASSKLRDLLFGLTRPTSATFSIAVAHRSPMAYFAIDSSGRPALLVETSSPATREVVRRGLRLQHRASCHVEIDGVTQEITASLVACESDDPNLQSAFVSISEIVLSRLTAANESEVVSILEELVELLERPGEPSREGAIGLFAELLILYLSQDPLQAVRSWRVTSSDRHDFVCGQGCIEVKASGTRDRRHIFSLEQFLVGDDKGAFVASTHVIEAAGGSTVRSLAARVKERVASDASLVMKVERALIATMGLPYSGEPTFDEAYATTKLKWYDINDLPAIRTVPLLIDQVKFRVDLSPLPSLTVAEVIKREHSLFPCLPVE